MKRSNALIFLIILFFLATSMVGCGGGGGDSDGISSSSVGTGTVSFSLIDASTEKYEAIYVTVDEVQVNSKDSADNGNSGWITVATPGKTYNLLKLVNGLTEVLGGAELDAGIYRQIRLIVGRNAESENNILGRPHPYPNYIISKDGSDTIEELKIPSGFQTGIKLVHNFEVLANTVVELVLDFDACRSVVETGNGKYLLKPTIKVIETANKYSVYGEVTEHLDPGTPPYLSGALVSAQISDGASATVVRSTLTSDTIDNEGQYSMMLSPDQNYNIVVYSDRKIGDPGAKKMYLPACRNITVPNSADSGTDFSLDRTDYGTISGEVSVDAEIDENNPPVVYISIYTPLDCGYVELVSLPMSPDPETNTLNFAVDLPLGTYDIVASGEGFVPATAPTIGLTSAGDLANVSLGL